MADERAGWKRRESRGEGINTARRMRKWMTIVYTRLMSSKCSVTRLMTEAESCSRGDHIRELKASGPTSKNMMKKRSRGGGSNGKEGGTGKKGLQHRLQEKTERIQNGHQGIICEQRTGGEQARRSKERDFPKCKQGDIESNLENSTHLNLHNYAL